MPLVCLTVPDHHRAALLEELRTIIDPQAEVVEQAGEHGDVGLRFDDATSTFSAVERTNALLKESGNLAGKYEVGVSAEDWRPPKAG